MYYSNYRHKSNHCNESIVIINVTNFIYFYKGLRQDFEYMNRWKENIYLKIIIIGSALISLIILVNMVSVRAESQSKEKYGEFSGLLYNLELSCQGNKESEDKSKELPTLNLYAKAAVLMDADSGRVLYDRNGKEQLPMASTTKIMTLIVTLENANPDEIVTVSSYAASMPDVQLNIREGEQYRLKDLLYSLMLESHNDSAVAIAEHVGGSVEQFAAMMNQKASELGCVNTCFITPNGLDATADFKNTFGETESRKHSTTAQDLATIMSYCITKSPQKDAFLDITRTQSYSFTDISGKRSFSCNNHNAFLTMMSGALSGKTGFTGQAGYCYVGALRQDGKTLVVALLACGWPNNKTYKWSDTRKLMEYGLKYYKYHPFDEKEIPEEALKPIPVSDAKTSHIDEQSYVSVKLADEDNNDFDGVLLNDTEEIQVYYDCSKELTAPVNAGEKVGYVKYMVGNEEWKRTDIITSDSIEKRDALWFIKMIFDCWLI